MLISELKQAAKEQLRGNWATLCICYVIYLAIIGLGGAIPVVGSAAVFVFSPALMLGLISIYLNLTKNIAPDINNLFDYLKSAIPALLVQLLMSLFIFLWTLLLIVPGIIKAFSYSMAFYILAENPDMSTREVLKASEKMMKGHKMDLFLLELSFIGWGFLCLCTFGIVSLYVYPYMSATTANFYNSIKTESPYQNFNI